MTQTILYITALILIAPGIAMAFVPMLPALTYMFVVSLIFALATGFATISIESILALLGVALVSIVIDHTSGVLGAKYGGAHTKSLLWGLLGAFIGTFFMPALGSFIGLFIGVLAAEMYYKKKHQAALKAASGALIGSVVGVVVNVCLSVVFFAAFAFIAFR